ncbi:MAG TPA: TetR/AcrR family transcriptional regulator, partial [Streptosporangiaceae bacterium]|nr:TetR/AcrR family transcriptional regulator [Streptosporangiaceae bacterium]
RPRSEQARQAILSAAMELASEEAPASMHMEAIAKRAGVSKETLYRWWHSKTEVILDAMAEYGQQAVPIPDTGTLFADLREFLLATADAVDPATIRVLRHLASAAAANEGEAIQIRDRFLARRRAALGELLERAVARGEIAAESMLPLCDLIYGSLWYRLIFLIGSVDHAWAEDLAAATASRRPTGPGPSSGLDCANDTL